MNNLHDSYLYKRSKEKLQEIEPFMIQLDKIADILYDNLNHDGSWEILSLLEEYRVKYYVEIMECKEVLKNKGKID